MTTARVILGWTLLTASLVCAQQARPAKGAGGASSTAQPSKPPQFSAQDTGRESFEITIIFRRYANGKRVTDRSYTLLATPGEILPAMRDDDRFARA